MSSISIQEVRHQIGDAFAPVVEFSISFITEEGKVREIKRGIKGSKDKYKSTRTETPGPKTARKMYNLKANYIVLVRDLDVANDPTTRDEGIRSVRLDRLVNFNGKRVTY